jgi:TIR domain
MAVMPGPSAHEYDVCLSFAAAQRQYVEEVAKGLRAAGAEVFYDFFETAELWGKDLVEHLDEIYRNRSRYCVLFASEAYAERMWTNHERRSAQARAIVQRSEYILPVRCDDTAIPGLLGTVGFLDARVLSPAELVAEILRKLGHPVQAEPDGAEPATFVALEIVGDSVPDRVNMLADLAAARSRLTGPGRIRAEDDGHVLVLPASTTGTATVLASFVPALVAAFGDDASNPDARLRLGVHAGRWWPCGGSPGASRARQLARASAVGAVFSYAPRASAVVAVSDEVYGGVVTGISPIAYHRVSGDVIAWVAVPGYQKSPSPRAARSSPAVREQGSSRRINIQAGNVLMGSNRIAKIEQTNNFRLPGRDGD